MENSKSDRKSCRSRDRPDGEVGSIRVGFFRTPNDAAGKFSCPSSSSCGIIIIISNCLSTRYFVSGAEHRCGGCGRRWFPQTWSSAVSRHPPHHSAAADETCARHVASSPASQPREKILLLNTVMIRNCEHLYLP